MKSLGGVTGAILNRGVPALSRCTRTDTLKVHHIDRRGGTDLANAQVLCQPCHASASTCGPPGTSPPDFDEMTKMAALERAGNRCECSKARGCH